MKNNKKITEALNYHKQPKPGKIEVIPTKPYATQKDLSLAYSPGVAEPCLQIQKDPSKVYDYTAKGNLVAVISNGTAVLGLGDIGHMASKPVMEGKGVLFKIFADIDVFDIEVDEKDPNKFVDTVKAIAGTFGGINLEDIKAPEAFLIEKRLKEELNIPVMHDDQHGTAIISAAALLNAVEITKKDISKIKMVVNGAGAAAISCTQTYVKLGVNPENILMLDSKGVITKDRINEISEEKKEFAIDTKITSLEEAIDGSDVFIGLSKGDILTPEMLLKMNPNPIIFALANPDPEIDYSLAMKTRDDLIMATGRSDYPNQVNNVLGFPYIFRGALDVRATCINDEMKLAAIYALSKLAKEPVPSQINNIYNTQNLSYGKQYIIPKPFDPRLISVISLEVAKAAVDSGVARKKIENWDNYRLELEQRIGIDNTITKSLINKAKSGKLKKLIFTEADDPTVLNAAEKCYEEKFAEPILLGRRKVIQEYIKKHKLNFSPDTLIIDPKSNEEKELKEKFTTLLWEKGRRKGITKYEAANRMKERGYFGAMMVETGLADCMLIGFTRSYPLSVRPILEVIGKKPNVKNYAGMVLLVTKKGPLFFSDVALVEDPTVEDLVDTTIQSCEIVKKFGVTPNIALLSYSNLGSSQKNSPKKMQKAIKILHEKYPEINVDGEFQANIALDQNMLKSKFAFSKLGEKNANTFIFPNLDSGNIVYKMITELMECDMVGPILLGTNKPIHILQTNCKEKEIINLALFAVVDAQMREVE